MTEPDNHTLHLLREIRSDIQQARAEFRADIHRLDQDIQRVDRDSNRPQAEPGKSHAIAGG